MRTTFPVPQRGPSNYVQIMLDYTPSLTERTNADINLRVALFASSGPHPGPRLVVSGPDDMMRSIADLFWGRPDLATIRGSVVLRADDQDPAHDQPDVVLELQEQEEGAAFGNVLALMAELSMIT